MKEIKTFIIPILMTFMLTSCQNNFDHEVTQEAPGNGPQSKSNIQSKAGVPMVRLNNGVYMPRFGFGTQILSMENGPRQDLNAKVDETVTTALTSDYIHLDTAHAYFNEKGVGYGILRSKVDRNSIWITSKLDPHEYDDASNGIDGILERLQTDYIDLLFLHHPVGEISTIVSAYRAMEEAYKAGKIRALGISNFDNRMEAYNAIMEEEIKPQVMQIECHPYAQRNETRVLAKTYDIQVECWFPLKHSYDGILSDSTLSTIAIAHNKSVAQVILRWHIQEGLIPIPGSTNAAHIKENINIFDFELNDNEINLIRGLDKGEEGRAYNIEYGLTWFTNLIDYTYIPEGFDNSSDNSSEGINFSLGKLFIILFFVFFA